MLTKLGVSLSHWQFSSISIYEPVRTTQELSFTDAARELDVIRYDMEELVKHVTGFSRYAYLF